MDQPISMGGVIEVLDRPERRSVLAVLERRDPPIGLSSLVASLPDETTDTKKSEYHHVHLPKLDATGLLTYDVGRNQIVDVDHEALEVIRAFEHCVESYNQNRLTEVFDRGERPDEHRQAVIVDLDIPVEDFALGDIMKQDPGISIELERIVPTEHAVLPFLWVSDGSPEAVEDLLQSSEDVISVRKLVDLGDEALFQLEWSTDINGVVTAINETDAVLMECTGNSDRWSLRLRFLEHTRFRRFVAHCDEHGIDIDLRAVYNPNSPASVGLLTAAQREALKLAVEWGYFKVPRETSLSELSGYFGISEQAMSQRIRRGLNRLVGASMTESK